MLAPTKYALSGKAGQVWEMIQQFLSSPEGSALVKEGMAEAGVYDMDGFLDVLDTLARSGKLDSTMSKLLLTKNTLRFKAQLRAFFSRFQSELFGTARPATPAVPAPPAAALPGIPMGAGNSWQAMAELRLTEADAKHALSTSNISTSPMYRPKGSPLYHKTVHTKTTSGARNPKGASVTTFFYVLQGGAYYLVAAGHHSDGEYRIDDWVSYVPVEERVKQADFEPPPKPKPKKGG